MTRSIQALTTPTMGRLAIAHKLDPSQVIVLALFLWKFHLQAVNTPLLLQGSRGCAWAEIRRTRKTAGGPDSTPKGKKDSPPVRAQQTKAKDNEGKVGVEQNGVKDSGFTAMLPNLA